MTRRRWIADEVSGDRAALTGENAHHLARVLRACVGEAFDISCGETVRSGTVASVADDRVEFELGEELRTQPQARPVHLLLAIFKFDRMEWAIEKATELGVYKIIPVIAQRTDSHLASAAGKRVERWRKIAREAAQQSRGVSSPEISAPAKLFQAIAAEEKDNTRIVLSEQERSLTLQDALQSSKDTPAICLALGPEGGWTKEELEVFAQHGWISASLGATILRSETAAIAAVAIIKAQQARHQ